MALLVNRIKTSKIQKVKRLLYKYLPLLLLLTTFLGYILFARNLRAKELMFEVSAQFYQTRRVVVNWLEGAEYYFVCLNTLRAENANLRQKLEKIENQVNENLLLKRDNNELSALLKIIPGNLLEYITAKFIGNISQASGFYGIVSFGSNQAVNKNDMVISSQGLIGKIVESSAGYAKILLINNSKFRVPVSTAGGKKAIFVGDVTSPHIAYMQDLENLHVGDVIFTNGDEGGLVPDIPVARIIKIDKNNVTVAPVANLDRLSMVTIIKLKNSLN